ncbi:MAG: hypothetical protein ACE5JQ_16270 [Candidatus Methylomirabilales bacterium]
MKPFYEIFILAFLIFYSVLSISLLGPWMYRKAQSLMIVGRLSSKQHGEGWSRGERGVIRRERLCGTSSV